MLIDFMAFVALAFQHPHVTPSYIPKAGFVPNEGTAIRIAEAVLSPIYGEQHVIRERPLTARLSNGVWYVKGTLPKPYTRGGVAEIEISKRDGRILYVMHGR